MNWLDSKLYDGDAAEVIYWFDDEPEIHHRRLHVFFGQVLSQEDHDTISNILYPHPPSLCLRDTTARRGLIVVA